MTTHVPYKLTAIILLALATITILLFWARQDNGDSRYGRVIRVGLYQNEPKIYTEDSGAPAGLFVDLLQEVAAREDWRLRFQSCEWSDCLARLRQGELDLMPDVAFSSAREQIYDFNYVAVAQAWSQIYGSQFHAIRSRADLADKRIAILQGAVQEAEIRQLMADAGLNYQPVLVDSLSAALESLVAGEADAAVVNNFFAWRNASLYPVVETPITFGQVGLYYASGKGRHRDLLNLIDGYLRQWRADPDSVYYQALRRASTRPVQTVMPTWVSGALPVAAALVFGLVLFNLFLRWKVRERTGQLLSANQRFNHLLNGSPAIIYSLRGTKLEAAWVSSNIERILGFSREQALQPGWWRRQLHPDDRPTALRMSEDVFQKTHLTHEYRFFDAWGKIRYIRDELQLVGNTDTEHFEVIGTWTDLTEAYEQKAKLSYLTHYDPLTGLPNRLLLHKHLTEIIDRGKKEQCKAALLCIDCDRFKNVNDSLGITAGDQVLAGTAERLRKAVKKGAVLARTGADEFYVILSPQPSQQSLSDLVRDLLQCLHEPMNIAGESIIQTVSIGSCLCPQDGGTPDLLMTGSELAMFAAKQMGGGCWQQYYPELSKNSEQKFLLENALRHAVGNGELILHFQPQFDLRDGSLIGAEALVRWNHPTQGMISPGLFIPLAEETGIIYSIDNWVLNTACKQLVYWDRQGFHLPRVAVNLSVSELDSHELLDDVKKALTSTRLPANRLELELTESMLMRAPESAIAMLNRLNGLGVSLAMDDFGTGYSNLVYLGRLPLDRLKIDQSFVSNLGESPQNRSIVRSIIAMATALDLVIVAEGIEEQEQAHFLREEGCQYGQGYLLGRPVTADKFFATYRPDADADKSDQQMSG